MAQKLTFKQQMIYTCAGSSLLVLPLVVLGIIGIIPLVPFVIILAVVLGVTALIIFALIKRRKKEIQLALKAKQEQEELRIKRLLQLYEIMGLEVQYNEDGSIKDVFELLNLKNLYNEKGERILTIYELLDILPTFNKDCVELPSIVVIKNIVKSFARGIAEPLVLTYKSKTAKKEVAPQEKPKDQKPKVKVEKKPNSKPLKRKEIKDKGGSSKNGAYKSKFVNVDNSSSLGKLIGQTYTASKSVAPSKEGPKAQQPFSSSKKPSIKTGPGEQNVLADEAQHSFDTANVSVDTMGIMEK
ncbi:MAG: hypothetical protein IJS68_01685 [Clostridia bacterium]|nr:hypothetical protein [Clostridia bacterium]